MSSDNSDLVSIIAELRFGNDVSLAIVTAVAYDYVITISDEIDYVWNRSWTLVTVIFALVRYVGMFVVLIDGLCTVLLLMSDWAFIIFLAAADIVMVLRVHALYNRSKVILGLLLILCVITILFYAASAVVARNPNTTMTMTNPQVLGMSFCNPEFHSTLKIGKYKLVPRLTLAALLFALVVVRWGIDSFQAYKETKKWETSKYVDLFFKESIIYFLVHVLSGVDFGQSNAGLIVNAIDFALMFILSPRFIISVRELYISSHLRAIDAGFGSSHGGFSQFAAARGENVEMETIESDHSSQ